MPGHPLIRLDRELDEACVSRLLDCFDFYVEEYAHRHFFFGFKQIVEIAIRALSPGINDPGTAIKAIDMLGVLLAERMHLPNHEVAPIEGQPRLYIRELELDAMLQLAFGPLRRYGSSDLQVLLTLLQACKNLLYAAATAPPSASCCAMPKRSSSRHRSRCPARWIARRWPRRCSH